MTDTPYTDDDLAIEAARQHYVHVRNLDLDDVDMHLDGQTIPSTGTAWHDADTYTTQTRIHELVTGAADTSTWAVKLGADGWRPHPGIVELRIGDTPLARVMFAFPPDDDSDDNTCRALAAGIAEAATGMTARLL